MLEEKFLHYKNWCNEDYT